VLDEGPDPLTARERVSWGKFCLLWTDYISHDWLKLELEIWCGFRGLRPLTKNMHVLGRGHILLLCFTVTVQVQFSTDHRSVSH